MLVFCYGSTRNDIRFNVYENNIKTKIKIKMKNKIEMTIKIKFAVFGDDNNIC